MTLPLLPLFVAALRPSLTYGHGYLKVPPARNLRQGETCPHCGNGANACGHRPGGQWFDNPKYIDVFDGVRATLIAGQVVELEVVITAHHRGHFEFSICDRRINTSVVDPDACLRLHKLVRVDPMVSYSDCEPNDLRGDCQPVDQLHPERWYLPPRHSSVESHRMRFQIPADLECTECTLQWRWWTANSCVPAQDYGCYFDAMADAGWRASEWCGAFCGTCGAAVRLGCGEEFRNCADIQVKQATSGSTPTPVPAPPSVVPTPSATPAPQLDCGGCKSRCQAFCNDNTGGVQVNQCWGTPRYIQCTCADGSSHAFDGCDCENIGACAPAATQPPTPQPEPESEEEEEENEEEEEETQQICQATPGLDESAGATDDRCARACGILPEGTWPCRPTGDLCRCVAPTPTPASQAPTPVTLAPTPRPVRDPDTTTQPTAAPTTTGGGHGSVCLHQKDCALSAWCNQEAAYETYCRSNGELNHCPAPYCHWSRMPGGALIEHAACGEDCSSRTEAAILLQKSRGSIATTVLQVHGLESACRADTQTSVGATDSMCLSTCSSLPRGWWPCGEGGPCVCDWETDGTTAAATPAPTPEVTAATTGQPVSTSAAASDSLLSALLSALVASDSSDVFMYNTGSLWMPSDIYTWDDMITAVRSMASSGVGQVKLWIGEGQNHIYGLVNIAAFLAQCMQETIQYNACDENNWSDRQTVQTAGGTAYSAASACGQMSQSYQDYQCSDEENALAGGQMACLVDNNMVARATTRAAWYGAPPQLFCAPKSKVPMAPRWDHSGWCSGDPPPYPEDVDSDTYFQYVNGGGECRDYDGQKAGGWKLSGENCTASGCRGSPAPLFGQPEGRSDVEGCCWWGRGVIQTTGVCNFGKLNFYLGKRAADEGRESLFPQVDFCKNPGSICQPGSPPELKWIAGFFYWLNAVQPYTSADWNFYEELKKWVDGGMNLADASFIDGTSGIVNRGCHDPPNCGTGDLHGGAARRENFKKVLQAMRLV